MELSLSVNGTAVTAEVAANELLLDFVRESLGLTGTKRSCDVQVCGACTVLLDGRPVSSCCTLAHEARDRELTTIEGLADRPDFDRLERAFTEHAAVQCGFCTPGLLLTIASLLDSGDLGNKVELRFALAGNLCRCTGYKGILEAVQALAGQAT